MRDVFMLSLQFALTPDLLFCLEQDDKEYVYPGFIFCDIIHVFFIYFLLNFRLYDSLKLKFKIFRKIIQTKTILVVWNFP